MKKILLGTTKDNNVVFGNYEIRTWNGYPEFSASFDSVTPFTPDLELLRIVTRSVILEL